MAEKITDRAIDKCRARFEAGEAKALFDAIDFCARSGTAMPLWIVDAYCSGYIAWANYQAKTFDEAFGIGRKGERIPERRRRQLLKPQVALEVTRLHGQDKLPIDEALFEQVGKTLEIPMGTVRDVYYKDNGWRKLCEAIWKMTKPNPGPIQSADHPRPQPVPATLSDTSLPPPESKLPDS